MGFVLSQKSLDKLKGVHPELVKVVKRAIDITDVDALKTNVPRTTN